MSLLLFVFSSLFFLAQSACLDLTAKGYYTVGKTFHAGLPPDSNGRTYVTKPPQLDYCELEQLSQYCVDRINLYRAGTLRFSDNSVDPGIPRPALQYAKSSASCSSSQAFGDLLGSTGGCSNAHANAFACPGQGSNQNACCLRTGMTFSQIKRALDGCFQQMWDEGIGLASNAGYNNANGHWYAMRSSDNKWASCGFAYSTNGGLWMNQDFFRGGSDSMSACSCSSAGTPDLCGGICVNADGSKLGSGVAETGAFSIAGVVLSVLAVFVFFGLVFLFVRRENSKLPIGDLGSKAEIITIVLQFVSFVLAAAAVGSPVWAEGNEITLGLWTVCVPSSSGLFCDSSSTASAGSQGVFSAVQAFAVIGMLLALFSFVGYIISKFLPRPLLFKILFGIVVLNSVVFFLAICFFGGYFLDELRAALTIQWGCGLEIVCWILTTTAVPFALAPMMVKV